MNKDRQDTVLTASTGAAIGVVVGMIVWLPGALTLIAALPLCLVTGAVMAVAPMRFWRSNSYSQAWLEENPIKRDAALPSVAVGMLTALVYKLATANSSWLYSLGVGVSACLFFGFVLVRWLEERSDRSVRAQSGSISVDGKHNYLGDQIKDFFGLLPATTRSISFSERPPLIQGIVGIGVPFVLLTASLWVAARFIGVGSLATAIFGGSYIALGLVVTIVALSTIWFITSLWEYPLRKRNKIIEPLVILAGFGFWAMLKFPFLPLFRQQFSADPFRLSYIATVPLLAWTLLRWHAYLGSATILADSGLSSGTKNLLLPSSSMANMPRSKMTNFRITRGALGWLLRYWVIKSEGQGQQDQEFQTIRVKYGPTLYQQLPSQEGGTRSTRRAKLRRSSRRYGQ